MELSILMLGLLIISTMTGLTTQAIKIFLSDKKVKYSANILSGIVSVIISIATSIGYIVITSTQVTQNVVVYIIVMIFLSWLSAMLGYDKIIQAISQFKSVTKND